MKHFLIIIVLLLTLGLALFFLPQAVAHLSEENQFIFGSKLIESQQKMNKVYTLAKAISKCEGYGKPGAIPTRLNNPGNIKMGSPADEQGHTKFKTSLAGWNALHNLFMTKYAGKTPLEMNRMGYARNPVWHECVEFYL